MLVVRGEAGTGKHTLLADAADHTDGFRLLRCTGVEAEVELPFAPVELARTELAYGRWLRRARRRRDTRLHLRAAGEPYERLGAAPWAERAWAELRASGETAASRTWRATPRLDLQGVRCARPCRDAA